MRPRRTHRGSPASAVRARARAAGCSVRDRRSQHQASAPANVIAVRNGFGRCSAAKRAAAITMPTGRPATGRRLAQEHGLERELLAEPPRNQQRGRRPRIAAHVPCAEARAGGIDAERRPQSSAPLTARAPARSAADLTPQSPRSRRSATTCAGSPSRQHERHRDGRHRARRNRIDDPACRPARSRESRR